MSEKTIRVDIVSLEKQLYSGDATHLVAPAANGEIGIYPRHTPLLTQLLPGSIRIFRSDGEEDVFYVAGGHLEIQPYVVTVLADTAARAADLDEAVAQQAKERSEQLLANKRGDFEYAKAAAELAEAIAQLRAIRKIRKKK